MRNTAVTVLSLSALTATQAVAMPHCGDRDAVIGKLSGDYKEAHIASGLQSDTGLMEIWASEIDGSWTILMTRPDGQTCVVATGTHWLEQETIEVVQGDPV